MVHVGGDSISCYCKFFRRYQLPCQHILHSDYLYNILDSNKWEAYARDSEGDVGLEIYKGAGEIEVMKEAKKEDNLANQKLKIKEIYHQLTTQFFELVEALDKEE